MSEPRILLVEDNHINQLVAQKILAKAGLSADVTDSGEKALEKLSTESYELVLMDVRLPGIDGIETSRRIRSQESRVLNHSVPIIALTAYASDEDQATCITAGMDDYLSKPLDIDAFLDLVRRYVKSEGSGPGESPPDTRTTGYPLFDSDQLLDQLGGDAQLAQTAVSTFLGLWDRKHNRLVAAAEKDDLHEAHSLAHSLAGAAGNVTAVALQSVLREVESAAGNGNSRQVSELLAQLDDLAAQTREALTQFQS
ncbi:MAG: response regulator [Spirochaetes bacterium]|jgi:CheY-like chemotaxis protein|nr:response regulator [Spirochaetota bacterium]